MCMKLAQSNMVLIYKGIWSSINLYFIIFFLSQAMKQGQSQLSIEAHECANSTPDLNKMIIAVQTLGMFNCCTLNQMLKIHLP